MEGQAAVAARAAWAGPADNMGAAANRTTEGTARRAVAVVTAVAVAMAAQEPGDRRSASS